MVSTSELSTLDMKLNIFLVQSSESMCGELEEKLDRGKE